MVREGALEAAMLSFVLSTVAFFVARYYERRKRAVPARLSPRSRPGTGHLELMIQGSQFAGPREGPYDLELAMCDG